VTGVKRRRWRGSFMVYFAVFGKKSNRQRIAIDFMRESNNMGPMRLMG
jgi:hypothetical protein